MNIANPVQLPVTILNCVAISLLRFSNRMIPRLVTHLKDCVRGNRAKRDRETSSMGYELFFTTQRRMSLAAHVGIGRLELREVTESCSLD